MKKNYRDLKAGERGSVKPFDDLADDPGPDLPIEDPADIVVDGAGDGLGNVGKGRPPDIEDRGGRPVEGELGPGPLRR